MEAALKVICDFSDIWYEHIFAVLILILAELEVHFLREEEFKEELHEFAVFFLFEVVISEHGHTAACY